ncbi:MAG: hypothetical protein JW885_11835 [Deltaproteobacteria bacterium]|nr:hypothetical protein [Candidatus Zymogenaceae bacterium]
MEDSSNQNNEVEIAYHEAGHAIAYLEQGLPVFEISILEKAKKKPFCRSIDAGKCIDRLFQLEGIDAGKDFIKKNIIALYAGSEPYSNLDISVVNNIKSCDWGVNTDFQLIVYYIELYLLKIGDDISDLDDFLSQLRKEAGQIVNNQWGKVQRLAEALLEKKALKKKGLVGLFPEYTKSYKYEDLIGIKYVYVFLKKKLLPLNLLQ